MKVNEVWTTFSKYYVDNIGFVPRCSRCGHFPKEHLLKHWFFSGWYCHRCVQDVYYDNVWTVKEVNYENEFVRDFRYGEWSV